MSKRVIGTPEFEAKQLFNDYINISHLFEYFYEDASPPDGVSKKDYIEELRKEFYKLRIEEAKRLLGLPQEIIYYYYEFSDGQVFEGRIGYGTLERRDKDHRTSCISPVYDYLKRFPDTKPKLLTNDTHYKTENIIYLYNREKNRFNTKMRIQINPRSLLNLEHICEVLYKLHPSVLDYLVEMERSLGDIFGFIDLKNPSLKEREFLANIAEEVDYSKEPEEPEEPEEPKDLIKIIEEFKKDQESTRFHKLRKYIQLDTDEYIPMKIYVEVEDPVIGRKLKELVEALEKTRAPEQFYFHKKEVDEDAYFAEGYNLTMNEEQKKQLKEFMDGKDAKSLEKLLREKKLYP